MFLNRLNKLEEKHQRSDVELSERPASLGIMGGNFRAPLKPTGPSQHYHIKGFKGAPIIGLPLCQETLGSRKADVVFYRLVKPVTHLM